MKREGVNSIGQIEETVRHWLQAIGQASFDNQIMLPAKLSIADTFIIDYGWSPDGRYLWLVINPSSPRSDEGIYAKIATAAADGSQFQVLGFGDAIGWRPDLNP